MPKKGQPRCKKCGYCKWTCLKMTATTAHIACQNCGNQTITKSKRAMRDFDERERQFHYRY
jgi:transcription elongation factor Elf1